ncbi:LAGLIDADG family homing endonuclease [Natranaeroarchaeum sulfidigenes]|nr:LAGLIDADG family homing endonuclease [Natranaeroarchaeum sulfidigenes]
MATAENTELVDAFEQFYRNYYREEIGELAQNYPGEQRSLYIDWDDLYRYDPDLADDFLSQPEQLQEYAEEALRIYDLPVDVSLGRAHVRLYNLPETTGIRDIRSRHVGQLLSVSGIVRKATDVRPKIEEAAFECQRCGTLNYIPQSSGDFQEPHECQGCERQGPFNVNFDQSEFVDAQKLRVQESPEGLRGGETPQAVDLTIEDDITGEVTAGDHVTVTGILHLQQQGNQQEKSPIFDIYMDGITVEIEDEQFEDMEITEEEKAEIIELSQSPDIYEKMIGSMAPSIYGYDQEKLAIILQLFSGVTKHLPDGSRIRGDLHMLLIGDPGTGKCVKGDTLVTLADGRERPIKEIVEANLTDPSPVDDGVYDSLDQDVVSLGTDGTTELRTATKVWKREAPDRMCQIRTASGYELEVTPSHPLFVSRPRGYEARIADELQVGDSVAISPDRPDKPLATDGGALSGPDFDSVPSGEGWPVERDHIESINVVEPEYDWVYDLEVKGTHSYLSNNVFSHNSQLLQYVREISPRSVYTSGKGSSAAGLTAAAVRDDFGDGQQWTLEAGAMVLADKGVAAVDELDKMDAGDRSAMHEGLEQQSYHPDTEVLLADGRRVEIGEFVDERIEDDETEVIDGVDCEIAPVEGVRIHSTDLDANETTKTSVDRVSRHEAPEEFVRVTFSNGRDVLVTPEHPMFVEEGGTIDTVEASSIEVGQYVPAPRKLPNSSAGVSLDEEVHIGKEKDVTLPEELSPDLAEILGLLTAEGHSYAGSSHEIGFSNQDPRLLDRIDVLMRDVFEMESTDTVSTDGTTTKRWVSTKLYRWFDRNFAGVMETARDKRIPSAVLGGSEEEIRRFLVGAFAGDGGVESEAMSFSTASTGLAEDYADALSKIGVATRIHHDIAQDSWKTYVMGDSTGSFVEQIVDPTDDRYDDARAFAERSTDTRRHHDVLPPSAAEEIRTLRTLLGIGLTGQFYPNVDEGFGVQIETVEAEVATLHERIDAVRASLEDCESVSEIRAAVDWSCRQLAERIDGETTSSISYAEDGGYNSERRTLIAERAAAAVRDALAEAEGRLDTLSEKTELRYYEVTNVETVPNEGDHQCEWVYDVTVEPTNTFVSQGVILHNSISISKAGINATLKSRCSLLGAANPKYGRFDQYESIGEQIDLEPALISRFDLIFTVTDQPDEEEDSRLAEHILQTNFAGELNTQREELSAPNVTREQVESQTEEVEPVIDAELLRKYVAHAKSNVYPTMSEEAKEAIRDFYVDLRSKGTDEDAPVPVTARKLEALVRLAEASARVRLADTVEIEDAERVIEIVRSCLQDIGVDPETGQYDADVVETGTSKSQRDRIKNIKQLIADIETEYDEGAPVDVVLDRADEIGMDQTKAEQEIEKLKTQGELYSPSTDHVRTT